ncbi:flavodoxin [Prolixibacteraceae bacterium JC049]|nr:flavodoxin [Prolixibacteraceae bacterium JC049]
MNKTAIFYSFQTNKSAKIAEKIITEFGNDIEAIDAESLDGATFLGYDNLILGVPTWFDGELPRYWDEFMPELEELDLKGKQFGIYGLGDQKGYPENFGDAVGLMEEALVKQGAKVVGYTTTDGYEFERSQAIREDQFCGLILDQENQGRLTNDRVKAWVEKLKQEFK